LRPIRVEELPPNEFFFDKKRKVVVKREFYQEGESTSKKYKVIIDGKDKRNEQFTTEIAGTLGAYATMNQFSVGLLKKLAKTKKLPHQNPRGQTSHCRGGCQGPGECRNREGQVGR
jgi:hypothetical protein